MLHGGFSRSGACRSCTGSVVEVQVGEMQLVRGSWVWDSADGGSEPESGDVLTHLMCLILRHTSPCPPKKNKEYDVTDYLARVQALIKETDVKVKAAGSRADTPRWEQTCLPPMDSNIFSSWTRSCWMLLRMMQGWKRRTIIIP